MPKFKDLAYSKYAQDWYKPKFIQKIWLKYYFGPIVAIKTIKAEFATKGHIVNDPDFEWLFHWLSRNGRVDIVIKLLENEYSMRQKIQSKLKERELA